MSCSLGRDERRGRENMDQDVIDRDEDRREVEARMRHASVEE